VEFGPQESVCQSLSEEMWSWASGRLSLTFSIPQYNREMMASLPCWVTELDTPYKTLSMVPIHGGGTQKTPAVSVIMISCTKPCSRLGRQMGKIGGWSGVRKAKVNGDRLSFLSYS
jgi:hypothetical protein